MHYVAHAQRGLKIGKQNKTKPTNHYHHQTNKKDHKTKPEQDKTKQDKTK